MWLILTLYALTINSVDVAFEKQMAADRLQGYDFVGYHGYAKRRYFEMVRGMSVGVIVHLQYVT